jgi:transcriptional regulator with XRE-family HTH domain
MTLMKTELAVLGRNISAARQQRGLSQVELARRSGLHRTYLSDVERGCRNLGFMSVVAIARGLGITVSELTRDVDSEALLPDPDPTLDCAEMPVL